MPRLTYIITSEDEDHCLGDVLHRRAGMSRRGITHAKYLEDGIMVDGVRARTNLVVHAGQVASVALDDAEDAREDCTVAAQADASVVATVGILYEDEALVVADKPAGMVMYPGPAHTGDTLGNVMLARCVAAGRPSTLHPVHRLDGGTSGAVVFAYNAHVQHALQGALHGQGFLREYVAFCEGVPGVADAVPDPAIAMLTCGDGIFGSETFTVDAPVARVAYGPSVFAAVAKDDPRGKAARTHFRVEEVRVVDTPDGPRTISRLRLGLETGRTHQIRIHLALMGHPLLGDATYGHGPFAYCVTAGTAVAGEPGEAEEMRTLARPALHSAKVELTHPLTKECLSVEAPLPEDLRALAAAGEAAD